MATIPSVVTQENRPLIFTLFTEVASWAALFNFPPLLVVLGGPGGVIHPEGYSYRRPSRGVVINTLDSAFLDDFGEGVGMISIEGHTGWGGGDTGLLQFKNLELMFEEYHLRRDAIANSDTGQDPSIIQLWLIDTLNLEASSIWPEEFIMSKSKSRPLLYQYSMRMVVLKDLLKDYVLSNLVNKNLTTITPNASTIVGIAASLTSIGSEIGSVVTNLIG